MRPIFIHHLKWWKKAGPLVDWVSVVRPKFNRHCKWLQVNNFQKIYFCSFIQEFGRKFYLKVLLCRKISQIFEWNGEQTRFIENYQPVQWPATIFWFCRLFTQDFDILLNCNQLARILLLGPICYWLRRNGRLLSSE